MFEVVATNGRARRGRLMTVRGVVETPCFMPIATKGAVKTMSAGDMKGLGAQILLSNTYHLLLRPGFDAMQQLGGLHRFMGWEGPILTDSGGYQVFSLSRMNKTTEEGVTFQSHIDGARLTLTPELSMQMQSAIGSDIAMQFDDVAAGDSTRERYEEAMERSLRWARRSKDSFDPPPARGGARGGGSPGRLLFGIVQGGIHSDLRDRSIDGLTAIDFDGYAIGGLSVGESREDTYRVTNHVASRLPVDKPRYFMGGGMPEEVVAYVGMGVDMFDCVLPTRNARHGTLFVWQEAEGLTDFYDRLHITNEKYALDQSPIDPHCACETCTTTSRAYLRHLFSVNELLALRLATIHNLAFYLTLMRRLRESIG